MSRRSYRRHAPWFLKLCSLAQKLKQKLKLRAKPHINTVPNRILPNGTILGCYHDTDRMSTMHGMMATRKGFSEFDFSEFDMATTMHTGATPNGKKIAGFYTDMSGRGRGYLLDGINFIPFDVPGSTFTQAWDLNPSREIVGLHRDAVGKFHGFLVDDDWQFTA